MADISGSITSRRPASPPSRWDVVRLELAAQRSGINPEPQGDGGERIAPPIGRGRILHGSVDHLADDPPSRDLSPVQVADDRGAVNPVDACECIDRGPLDVTLGEFVDLSVGEPALHGAVALSDRRARCRVLRA